MHSGVKLRHNNYAVNDGACNNTINGIRMAAFGSNTPDVKKQIAWLFNLAMISKSEDKILHKLPALIFKWRAIYVASTSDDCGFCFLLGRMKGLCLACWLSQQRNLPLRIQNTQIQAISHSSLKIQNHFFMEERKYICVYIYFNIM